MGDARLQDYMLGVLHDAFGRVQLGVAVEELSSRFGITRTQMDALAVESHRRAAAAIQRKRCREALLAAPLPCAYLAPVE
jgi:acetyl-CoA C-acetyltransferase